MKIAVYTIAKNEEQFVEKWAESAKEADYLFILDTGSTDNTVEKAKSLGINVVVATIDPWRFDLARNASLSLIPDDIDMCIALDMDEVLVPGWREELEKVKPETTRPRYKYTWSWENGKPGLQYGGDKIHSRHGYRWKHPVHEVLVADEMQEIQEWTNLEIHHFPDQTKSRGQYFPLLELAVEEDPTDDRNTYYLAREYFFHNMLDKASEMFKRHLDLPSAVWAPERAASMRYLAKCEPEKWEYWLMKARQESPGRRECLVELAYNHYVNKNWQQCLNFAFEAITITEKPLDYLCEAFAWSSLPFDLASIAAYNVGSYEEAVKYGEIAVNLDPNNERLVSNLKHYMSVMV